MAPPLDAPAQVIPGRTLLEVEVGLAPAPPLKFIISAVEDVIRQAEFLFPYLRREAAETRHQQPDRSQLL
jgi:hypothetical protein